MRARELIRILIVLIPTLLAVGPAEACCSAKSCGTCVGKTCYHCQACTTSNCPTCNVFSCNCETQCQCWDETPVGPVKFCSTVPCCSYTAADRAAALARFREVDQNHDGRITASEARRWLDETYGKRWVDRMPDDKTTADQKFKRAFRAMDLNHDGFISPREFDSSLR